MKDARRVLDTYKKLLSIIARRAPLMVAMTFVLAIVSGVGELIGRSLGGVLAVKTSLGYLGICLSNPFAWGLAMFYCLFMVCRILRRETQIEA